MYQRQLACFICYSIQCYSLGVLLSGQSLYPTLILLFFSFRRPIQQTIQQIFRWQYVGSFEHSAGKICYFYVALNHIIAHYRTGRFFLPYSRMTSGLQTATFNTTHLQLSAFIRQPSIPLLVFCKMVPLH